MSGRNEYKDEDLRNFLERIAKKVENSPALNGGWDRLVVTVDNIKEKQEETCVKVDKIHTALYEPDTGFFARVKTIEHETTAIKDRIVQHIEEDEKFYDQLKESVENSKPAVETKETVDKLHLIAGKNLEELETVIKIRKTFERMFWLVAAGVGSVVGKMIWEIISK